MRIFGLFLLVCGLGLGGYGGFLFFQPNKSMKGTETQLAAARTTWENAKGSADEEGSRKAVEDLQLQILGESQVAAVAKMHASWWMAGGGAAVFLALVAYLLGAPQQKKTKATRFWA